MGGRSGGGGGGGGWGEEAGLEAVLAGSRFVKARGSYLSVG